jgi:predicted SnoaL-like aldol condensation-catalyzing enzyme
MADLESNKRTVFEFFDLMFNQKRVDLAMERCVGPTYTQHNPDVGDSREGLETFVRGLLAEFPDFHVTVVRAIAEGDVVAAHTHATRTPGERGVVSMDMFRLENGRLVEHWDVIQEIPETSANSNGML